MSLILNHGSLFTGEGGFDIAAEWMGWENIFHCELNNDMRWYLNKRWPNAKSYADIKQTDFTIWRGRIDILTGGFPCQPYSQSGKRLGKEDDRHLWPEMLRAIRESQPAYVVGENVLGIVSWNGGVVFEEVQADLESEGYEVQTYVLPAASVGAPHQRYRVWFVAHSNKWSRSKHELRSGREMFKNRDEEIGNVANSCSSELQRSKFNRSIGKKREAQEKGRQSSGSICSNWENFPTQSPICTGDDGFSSESLRQAIREDSMGYLSEKEIDKIFSEANNKWRKAALMAGGNAVVPQIPYKIFKAIQQFEQL